MNATTTISAKPRAEGICLWRLQLGARFALFDSEGRDVTPKGRKSRAILACLAIQPGQPIRRERLIELLWGDRFEAQARLSLRQCLFEIRKAAGGLLIQSDRENLWIEPSAVEIVDDGEDCFAALGGITPELDDWLSVERERRAGESFAQLNAEAEALLNDGRAPDALRLIDRMRRLDSFHECWLRLAMRADHQGGNTSAIEKRFTEFSQMLERELGVGPSTETRLLRDRLIGELTKVETTADGVGPAADQPASELAASPTNARTPTDIWRSGRLRHPTAAGSRRLVIAAAAAALLVFGIVWARNSVVEQRRQAESMAEFMLGNFKDKIAPSGKLDAIQGVAQRVVDYYTDRSNADLSDPELRQRSKALSLLGQVQDLRGNTEAAARFYALAAAGTAEEVRRSPNDPQRLFDHAQNIFYIGEIARQRGRMDEAEAAYRQYKQLADQMHSLDPDSLKWRMEVLYANENVGIILLNQRRFAEAAAQFENALHPMQSVVSLVGSNADYQKEVATVLAWLGDANRAQGRYGPAIEARQRQIELLQKLTNESDGDTDLEGRLIFAIEGLGLLYQDEGQIDRSVEQDHLALDQAQRLMAVEPANTMWLDSAAYIRFDLAKSLLSQGRKTEAATEIDAACDAANTLMRRDSTVLRWRTLQFKCFASSAELALESGANSQSLDYAQRAVAAAKALNSGDRVADAYVIAGAYRLLGDIAQQTGDSAAAKSAWSAGLGQVPPNMVERPWEMNVHAQLLQRLGKAADAEAMRSKLAAMSYRVQA